MTPVTNVRIWWDTSISAYRMSSPYNAALVDAIKQFIPVSDRAYDPATKIWTIVERQLTPLQGLFKTLNIQPTIITRQQAETAAQSGAGSTAARGRSIDAVVMEFVKLCPYDAMLKAYRNAAMQLHPDRGGDMDKMTTFNAAWSRIQKEVYGQQ